MSYKRQPHLPTESYTNRERRAKEDELMPDEAEALKGQKRDISEDDSDDDSDDEEEEHGDGEEDDSTL